MTLHAPQLIMLVLMTVALGISLSEHGQERRGTKNFFTDLIATIISFGLLWWGGFFT